MQDKFYTELSKFKTTEKVELALDDYDFFVNVLEKELKSVKSIATKAADAMETVKQIRNEAVDISLKASRVEKDATKQLEKDSAAAKKLGLDAKDFFKEYRKVTKAAADVNKVVENLTRSLKRL